MSYAELLRALDYPQIIVDAHEGRVKVPKYSLTAPCDPQFGFPPILIPLWSSSDWPGYIAVVTSWFGGDDHGFVKHYSEEQSSAEIALNLDQLKVWMAFDFLCEIPDQSEVREFAESFGLCDKNELKRYFYGIREQTDFKTMSVFEGQLPQIVVGGLNNAEPAWQRTKMTDSAILSAIDEGQYLRAWHGINAPGRSMEQTARLLDKIAPVSTDVRFETLVECWKRASAIVSGQVVA